MRAIVVAVLCCLSFAFGAGMMSLATTMQSKHHATAPDDLIFAGTCDMGAHCAPARFVPTGISPPAPTPLPAPSCTPSDFPPPGGKPRGRGATINITDVSGLKDGRIAIVDPGAATPKAGASLGHVYFVIGACSTLHGVHEFLTQVLDVPYESDHPLMVETWRK